MNSGLTHDHASGEYRVRRGECERACQLLGIGELRDLDPADLVRSIASLPEPLDRRVRHVITENLRVAAAREAMRHGDLEALGRLFVASHESMRNDYEISRPEIDRLVATAIAQPDVLGARLTGGGFGGCIVILARAGSAARVGRAVVEPRGLVATAIRPSSCRRCAPFPVAEGDAAAVHRRLLRLSVAPSADSSSLA